MIKMMTKSTAVKLQNSSVGKQCSNTKIQIIVLYKLQNYFSNSELLTFLSTI